MIIDFHTHVFPDKIAERTILSLMETGDIKSYGNGTLKSLTDAMKTSKTDKAVVLPICTKPSQFDSVNRFALELNKMKNIFSFGGIHPECENIREKLRFIKSSGFRGIKLHPDYQEMYIDDEKFYELIKTAVELDLYVTIHAGVDVSYSDDVHCTPKRSRKLIDRIYGDNKNIEPRIIFAHLGGIDMYDDVEKYLVGQPVYFDLAVILSMAEKEQVERIIKTHGADKILYASDFPWSDLKSNVSLMNSLDISSEEKELILHKNAEKILNI
ncbi:MAG: amidohydrolase family protein [Ruminococcus sp.]|nr:amidohydrolase family protein [Ruminococcus sp.]